MKLPPIDYTQDPWPQYIFEDFIKCDASFDTLCSRYKSDVETIANLIRQKIKHHIVDLQIENERLNNIIADADLDNFK